MPTPKMPEYPKPMFKPDQDPTYANTPKHEDELALKGWSASYVFREYPKVLHHPKEKKTKTVFSSTEEVLEVAQGWLVAAPEHAYGEIDPGIPNLPLPQAEGASALKDQLAEMQKVLAQQQALINSLLLEKALVTEDDPPRRNRKSKEDAA